jgi:photosystem II stability/assembly factor-like uncharacterized protein
VGGLPAEKTVYAIASHAQKPRVIYAAFREGIYGSPDGGRTWASLKGSPSDVVALAIDPGRPEIVYAATGAGAVYRSEDSGESWRRQTEAVQGKKR